MRSINVSNHKFGLVYPGMGTVVFRDASDLPEELVFHINYLGGDMPNYSLNFSRPSNSVILQYFTFLRLGREGYGEIVASVLANAQALAAQARRDRRAGAAQRRLALPDRRRCARRTPSGIDLTLLSRLLRERGWIVPAYTLPPERRSTSRCCGMVVKENFSRDMVDMLAHDVRAAIGALRAAAHRAASGAGAAPAAVLTAHGGTAPRAAPCRDEPRRSRRARGGG